MGELDTLRFVMQFEAAILIRTTYCTFKWKILTKFQAPTEPVPSACPHLTGRHHRTWPFAGPINDLTSTHLEKLRFMGLNQLGTLKYLN